MDAHTDERDALARGLGWFSLGLGATQVVAPRRFARLIGLEGGRTHGVVMRLVGVRELAAAYGILARRQPAAWLGARVAGDAMDLALLAVGDSWSKRRKAAAMAAVAGVVVPDVLETMRLSKPNELGDARVLVTKAVTVQRSADDLYEFWRDFTNLPRFMVHLESVELHEDGRSRWTAKAPAGKSVAWDAQTTDERPGERIAWESLPGADVANSGAVWFTPAPGDRGTEVTVELRYSPPGGALGAAAAKLFGEDPATQLADDLRRFKQVVETGEVIRSEASPRGHSLVQQLKQRAAQPVGERA